MKRWPQVAEIASTSAEDLFAALKEAGLPHGDLGGPEKRFYRFMAEGQVVGYAGLEVHGADALLRSVVVLEPRRGQGFGKALVQWTLDRAGDLGVVRLHLLTTTAAGFFAKLGFVEADRSAAPPAIAATAEFRSLCPSIAICMTRALKSPR